MILLFLLGLLVELFRSWAGFLWWLLSAVGTVLTGSRPLHGVYFWPRDGELPSHIQLLGVSAGPSFSVLVPWVLSTWAGRLFIPHRLSWAVSTMSLKIGANVTLQGGPLFPRPSLFRHQDDVDGMHVWLFATPTTVAHQARQSMGFSRQEYWSRLPFPPPGDLPNPRGLNPHLLHLPHWQEEPLPPGNPLSLGVWPYFGWSVTWAYP